jgi:hypothetical protein
MQMTSLGTTPSKNKKSRSKSCISPKQKKQRCLSPKTLDMEDNKSNKTLVQKIIARNKVEQKKKRDLDEMATASVGSYEQYILSCLALKMTVVGSHEEYILSSQEHG